MNIEKTLNVAFYFYSLRFIALLFVFYTPGAVFAESKENSELIPKHIQPEKENADKVQEIVAQLESFKQSINDKLTDIERNTNISSEINNLNQSVAKLPDAIESSSSGFFGLILQMVAIFVGVLVAISVMNTQIEQAWKQLSKNQEESWTQLLYSLGIQEILENKRKKQATEESLQKDEKIQNALRSGLQIYLAVLLDYSTLAVKRIESISETIEEARNSLSSIKLPSPPSGLWENLHSYTNVTNDASSAAIIASHLYELSKHYFNFQEEIVMNKLKAAERAIKEEKDKKPGTAIVDPKKDAELKAYTEEKDKKIEEAIAELRAYKEGLIKSYNDIREICINAMNQYL